MHILEFRTDEPLMNDVMLTLAALLVRTEFCKKVEDAGGLELIHNVLIDFHDNDVSIKFLGLVYLSVVLNFQYFSFAETYKAVL